LDQRRKVLITSIVVSIGIFGTIWWTYTPETARPTWQERLGEADDDSPYPSVGITRTRRTRPREKADGPRSAQARDKHEEAKDDVPATLVVPKEIEHVAVEITGSTSDQTTWNDPENQKILGDKRWMAVESPAENARIRALLDKPMPSDPRATPLDRRTSIDLLKPEVEFCVESVRRISPAAKGRLVVSYDLSASGEIAVIQNADVDPIIGFEGVVGLRECIVDRIQSRTFDASRDGERLRVEYPFFFD
jgi:hypothetical protein